MATPKPDKYEHMSAQQVQDLVARRVLKGMLGKIVVTSTHEGVETWPQGSRKWAYAWTPEQRRTLDELGANPWGIPWERLPELVAQWLKDPQLAALMPASLREAAGKREMVRQLQAIAEQYGARPITRHPPYGLRVATRGYGDYDFAIHPDGVTGRAERPVGGTQKLNIYAWEVSPERFRALLDLLGAHAPAPRIHVADALPALVSLEGDTFKHRQWADMGKNQDPHSQPANQTAWETAMEEDRRPEPGVILGEHGRAYAVLPDGEVMLLSETADADFIARARQLMRIA